MGASLCGGRWKGKGTLVTYSVESGALCVLEVLVNTDELADGYIRVSIDVPDDLAIASISIAELPNGGAQTPALMRPATSEQIESRN
jgi:RES domain-containing protein